MANDTKVDGRTTCVVGKVLKLGRVGTSMTENMRITNKKASELTRIPIKAVTKANGKLDACTVSEHTLLLVGTITKVSGREVSDMVKVRDSTRRLESLQKENGWMISSMRP